MEPHFLVGDPNGGAVLLLGLAAEADLILDLGPLYLPWVAISEPDVRQLLLVPALVNGLAHKSNCSIIRLFKQDSARGGGHTCLNMPYLYRMP